MAATPTRGRFTAWPKAGGAGGAGAVGCPLVSQAAYGDSVSHIAEFYSAAARDDKPGTLVSFIDPAGNLMLSGCPTVIQCVDRVALTAAQINGMYAAPQSLLPAPAANQAILVSQIHVELDLTATQFAAGGVVHFYYHGQTVELMAQTLAAATLIGSASPSQVLMLLEPVQTAGGSIVKPALGLDITNATQAFTTGTGAAVVTIWYDLLTLG